MKYVLCNTPWGQYIIPLLSIANHRAEYYAGVDGFDEDSDDWNDELDYVLNDDYEGIDWLLNNTDWQDWENTVAEKVNERVLVLEEDFWNDSNNFKIISKHEIPREEFSNLREIAKRLYFAGTWTCTEISHEEQVKLWTELRDALKLEKGSATKKGVGSK